MKTEELIESLVHDAKPVRRMPSPAVLAAVLALSAVVTSLLGVSVLGFRPDVGTGLFDRRFIMINTMLLLTLGAAAFVLSTLAIPGRQRRFKVQAIFGGIVLAVLLGMFLMRWPWFYGLEWRLWCNAGLFCTVRTVFLGAPATGLGVWMHRHGAPMNPGVSGGLIGGATGAQGANAMGWACDFDEPMHVLVSHFLIPTAILTLIGVWSGRRWLRW